MKKAEAEELSGRLSKDRIDHEVRYNHFSANCHSVRAYLTPLESWGWDERELADYVKKAFAAMTETGDWEVAGSEGRAYVTRY